MTPPPEVITPAAPAPAVGYHDNNFLSEPLTEYVDYENLYLFQTSMADLEKLLPEGTKCLRIAEGKGLFGLGMQNFLPNQFREDSPEIQKIYCLIAIEPDYEIKMATPRFCFFALRVATTDQGFNQLTYDVNKYPIYNTAGLRIDIDRDNYTASASDCDGRIFDIDTPFKHKNFSELSSWGQNVTAQNGRLYWQSWNWAGRGIEFFLNKQVGRFYDHPFLAGINTADLTCRHIFAAEGHHTSTMILYKPIIKLDLEKDVERPMREQSQEFSDKIALHLPQGTAPKSQAYFDELRSYLAGGIHYNFHGFPLKFISKLIKKGKGTRVWDCDGREYLDLYAKFGAMFLGHGHKAYNEKLKQCIDEITVVDSSGFELEAAERLLRHVPSADLVRFSLSGTEAVQNAIRLARAYTGKNKIIRFYGHYHGNADNLMGGKAGNLEYPWPEDYIGDIYYTEGRARNIFRDQVYVTPWNQTSMLEMLLEERQDEVAAIIMEPMCINGGGILPEQGYLEDVSTMCARYGVLLIFDEVITGIRCGLGGAQGIYGVKPDITVYGKAMSGGAVPVSAIMGRKEVMDMYTSFRAIHGGTFNGYPLGMAAVAANLAVLEEEGDYYGRISGKANQIATLFKDAATAYGIPLSIQGPPTGLTFHVNEGELDSSLQFTKDLLKKNMLMNIIALEHGILFSPISRMYANLQISDDDVAFFADRVDGIMKDFSETYEEITA